MISIIFCVMVALLASGAPVSAEDATDEDQLFSSGDTVVSQEQINDDKVDDELKEKRIGFSGQINADLGYTNYSPAGDLTGFGGSDQNLLSDQISADLFVDIRLQKGIKGFLSVGVDYYPAISDLMRSQLGLSPNITDYTSIGIKEFFVDTNWKNKIYFRTGKQYLKWGQGYFWNPTDFINTDKKDFLNMNQVMSGTFGTKIHVPSGVKQNLYFFVGADGANQFNDISLSGKYEFLVKNTEMAFSTRIKNDLKPVYGFDITGRLLQLDYRGEISLTDGENCEVLDYTTLGTVTKSGELIPRASFGFTKYFTVGEIKDQISVTTEFYYNQAGYDRNILERIAQEPDGVTKNTAIAKYTANLYSNSKYYFALFGSVQKFIVPEMTLGLNSMMNLDDKSAVLVAGLSYVPALTDLQINFNITGYLGAANTEATYLGNRWSIGLGTKIAF